ncbi:MAG: hypothetical protein KatS3mg113_0766 [Planctomycetaceae bacterium]|nr:MAG: hypothetical protein KatS3mg113_0766 [Planctomycetaceae bacterium]
MILEGLVTTVDSQGALNLAPMGAILVPTGDTFCLRPYHESQTYQNLCACPWGVFHVTDDACLMARAALNTLVALPPMIPARKIHGWVLADCCRWYEFEVVSRQEERQRCLMQIRVIHQETLRNFLGFNRARHALIEGTILATRLPWLSAEEVQVAWKYLAPLVSKTGDIHEQNTWAWLTQYVCDWYQQQGMKVVL